MRIPLDLVKRGEQAISWYMGGKQIFNSCRQFVPILQRQSRQLMKLSAYWRCHPFRNVGLLGVLQGVPWPATSGWKLSWRGIPVNLHRHRHPMRSSVYSFFGLTSVAPYSIILLVMDWRFCGVLLNYHFGSREAGKSLMNSSSRDAFIAWNTCPPLVGSVPDEGVASSSVRFFLLYIQCTFLIFSLFHLCWLLRETKRETIACYFVAFRFRQQIFRHLTLRQYSDLPSKYLLKVSFHFLTSFICS